MKKQILNLGKGLNKAEQKQINGGAPGGGPSYAARCYYGNMGASELVGDVLEYNLAAEQDSICSSYGSNSFGGWVCISFCTS